MRDVSREKAMKKTNYQTRVKDAFFLLNRVSIDLGYRLLTLLLYSRISKILHPRQVKRFTRKLCSKYFNKPIKWEKWKTWRIGMYIGGYWLLLARKLRVKTT